LKTSQAPRAALADWLPPWQSRAPTRRKIEATLSFARSLNAVWDRFRPGDWQGWEVAMKVTLERTALLKALGHVHRIVERRNTIPILSNVLIEARARQLTLKATDLDLEATESAPADVAQEGSTTVPAHVLYEIVRKLPEGAQVSLEMTGDVGQLLLRSGRARFHLQCLPASDFPDLTTGDLSHRFVLSSGDLKKLIDNTQFAISTEETRYYLNGIFLHVTEVDGAAMLRAVATDGHRLARVELPAPQGAAGMPGVIVPRKAVNEIQKLIEDLGQEIAVELSSAKARFQFGEVVLTTKLIDGTFPDYGRVIPANNDKRLVVEKGPFERAVDRVSTISSERGRAIKLSIGDGKMVLSVNNPDSGSASEEIEVDYDSSPIEIGFNARYLLDIAGQLSSDTALLKLSDPGSPTIIQDRDGAAALFVLMPLRV
jgi:DNA polymerase III subunit beta